MPFKNIFYGGWELSGTAFAYSGLPYTAVDTSLSPTIATYTNGAYGGTLLPTYLGSAAARCDYGKDQCVTKAMFSSTLPGQANVATVDSNLGRNAFRGPKYISTDFAVTKSIPLHWEGGRLALAAQAFNVLNHLNFSRPSGALASSAFGQVASTVNPSGIFSGVGGDDSPRILQVKAKIEF